ncbi:MAG TPA: hypothetical protein VK106_07070, partial [Balneolaceae bacterium]|nr:hypothetical protein [Balneolaceae bacterium]
MKKLFSCLILFFASFSLSIGQITLTPTNIFVNSKTRFGSYMVINNSNKTQEISIDFVFGYSKIDDEGNKSFMYDDSSEVAEKFSAAQWIR